MKKLLLLFLLLLSLQGVFAFDENSPVPAYKGFGCGIFDNYGAPVIQHLDSASAAISWFTTVEGTGWIEYGESPELGSFARHSYDGLYDAGSALHRSFLKNLKPGTCYYYKTVTQRIGAVGLLPGRTVESDVYSFTTPGQIEESIRFAVFNDTHEHTEIVARLGQIAAAKGAQMIFFNGDSLNDSDSAAQIVKKVFKPLGTVAAGIPVYFMRGNHETRGRAARDLRNFIYTPEDGFYSLFRRGPLAIMLLDGGEDKPDNHKEYHGLADFELYREKETAWLREQVLTSAWKDAPFRIVLNHIPIWRKQSDVSYIASKKWQHDWLEILEQSATNLVLSAHTHRYEVRRPGEESGHNFFQIIGGAPAAGKATAIIVEVTQEKISVEVVSDAGKTIDTFTIK